MTLDNYMKDLADQDKPVKHSGLLQLSSLETESQFEFKSGWFFLPHERKIEILEKLADLSENNLELDFNSVFRACLSDESEDVREIATRGLWECDDRVLIRPLLKLFKEDPSPKVRTAAIMSLAKFASMAQDGKILERDGEKIRAALLEIIEQDGVDLDVRRRAIEAVACFNTPEIESLISEAYESSDPKLKQSALYAMGRSSNPDWLPTVLKEIKHDDAAIRYEAANAVGQLGDESVVPHLINLIKDDDVQVQVSAVQSLGSIGGQLAKRALTQAANLGDETVEEAAQTALSNIEFDDDPMGFKIEP